MSDDAFAETNSNAVISDIDQINNQRKYWASIQQMEVRNVRRYMFLMKLRTPFLPSLWLNS